MIGLKRVFEPSDPGDGRRYLVDRLWPRGLTKEEVAIDEWVRELAPSNKLRRWYGHVEDRFLEFRERYRRELEDHKEEIGRLAKEAGHGPITLVFSARDIEHCNAWVLRERILEISEETGRHAGTGKGRLATRSAGP